MGELRRSPECATSNGWDKGPIAAEFAEANGGLTVKDATAA
jgi:hypothetical protein